MEQTAVDYALIDAGGAGRLERFGAFVVDRPYAAGLSPPRYPDRWPEADLRFERTSGWTGGGVEAARGEWSVELGGLTMELRPTEAGQVGLFPEHASMLSWLLERVAARSPGTSVLHLFAYTGLATLALARSGAAVTHVDASKAAVAWARRNAAANGLADRPIRWLTEDVRAFVARERRRGRRYDGLVIDPPGYGHGTSGRAWRLETDLDGLIADCRTLLEPDGFVLLTAHTEGIGPDELAGRLRRAGRLPGSAVEAGPLEIEGEDGLRLRLGAFARWDGRTR